MYYFIPDESPKMSTYIDLLQDDSSPIMSYFSCHSAQYENNIKKVLKPFEKVKVIVIIILNALHIHKYSCSSDIGIDA